MKAGDLTITVTMVKLRGWRCAVSRLLRLRKQYSACRALGLSRLMSAGCAWVITGYGLEFGK